MFQDFSWFQDFKISRLKTPFNKRPFLGGAQWCCRARKSIRVCRAVCTSSLSTPPAPTPSSPCPQYEHAPWGSGVKLTNLWDTGRKSISAMGLFLCRWIHWRPFNLEHTITLIWNGAQSSPPRESADVWGRHSCRRDHEERSEVRWSARRCVSPFNLLTRTCPLALVILPTQNLKAPPCRRPW